MVTNRTYKPFFWWSHIGMGLSTAYRYRLLPGWFTYNVSLDNNNIRTSSLLTCETFSRIYCHKFQESGAKPHWAFTAYIRTFTWSRKSRLITNYFELYRIDYLCACLPVSSSFVHFPYELSSSGYGSTHGTWKIADCKTLLWKQHLLFHLQEQTFLFKLYFVC